MTRDEALKILGLKSDFTEDDLKKAYRELSKKYHPDFYTFDDEQTKQEMTAKFKEINAAYGELSKNFQTNTKRTYETGYKINIEEYKKEKLKQFKQSVHCQEEIKIPGFAHEIENFLNILQFLIAIANTKKLVDETINLSYEKFDKLLLEQVNFFCLLFGITEEDLNKCFNLKLEIEKRNPNSLYSKLIEVYKKTKELKIETVINKYTGYAGYDSIADKIEDFKQEAINSNGEIEKIVEKLQENIDQAFANYFKNMSLLNELDELSKSIDNPELLKELKELTTKVNSDDFKKSYDDLKRKINDYNELKTLDKLFNDINEKGADALTSCKSLYESMQIYTVFYKLLEQLKKNVTDSNQLIVTEELKSFLNSVDFQNFKATGDDINILSSLNDDENIYLRVNYSFWDITDAYSFYIERDNFLFKMSGITLRDKLDKEVLGKKNFIKLSEFLGKAELDECICERSYNFSIEKIYKIYTYNDRSICLVSKNGKSWFEIFTNDQLVQKDRPKEVELLYRDKNYLIKAISEQLNNILDEELAKEEARHKYNRKRI